MKWLPHCVSPLFNNDFNVVLAAVATHKYVISFCVGVELVTARTPLKLFCAYMAVFALVSPLGVGVGIGISTAAGTGPSYTLAVAILQASDEPIDILIYRQTKDPAWLPCLLG